jgi:hypothetical protein
MIRPLAIALTLAPASMAGAFELGFPVDCVLGESCFIQNYFDHDTSPGLQDFTCGPLTYDGHDGTDIRLPTNAWMEAGVAIHPVAPGRVKGMRDGMPDIPKDDPDAPALNGRDCGNGVVIDHGGGWETQYCHMKFGTVTVKTGDQVGRKTVLGTIGLSGNTVFPHLHLAVRRNGVEVDPFTPETPSTCGAVPDPAKDLWEDPIAYDSFGFLDAGITDAAPDYAAVKNGLPPRLEFAPDTPALVIWAFYFGVKAGDVLTMRLKGPEETVIDQAVTIDRTQAQAMQFTGRKAREPWPLGDYNGMLILTRDGAELERRTLSATVK